MLYLATVVFSVLFLYFGNQYASKGAKIFFSSASVTAVKAKVVEIVNIDTNEHSLSSGSRLYYSEITFRAKVLDGPDKGKTVQCGQGVQNIDGVMMSPIVKPGDKILMRRTEDQSVTEWQYLSLLRTDKLMVLGILFLCSLLLFGRMKGLNTILSLFFTCLAVFTVFVPAIMSGKNIYLAAIITCVYTVVMTFLLINGGNRKTLTAILGCLGGITVSGILTVIMDKVLVLTGFIDEGSYEISYLLGQTTINLRAIIFAAILIGAMGAIMDIAMSIASSLWEVKEKSVDISAGSLFKSGINIGRDVMGTMANTLILAYIGSSLSSVLILSSFSLSLTYLLNQEVIIVEILQALVGSFGILLTIPLTAVISSAIFTRNIKMPARRAKGKAKGKKAHT